MKKSELKSIIKECVKEVLFEEGVLSNLVAEVAFGIAKAQAPIVETKQPPQMGTVMMQEAREQEEEARRKKLLETKRKMLDAKRTEYQQTHKKRKKVLDSTRAELVTEFTNEAKQMCKKKKAEFDKYTDNQVSKRKEHINKVLALLHDVL